MTVGAADCEIDLSADNAAELRGTLGRYAAKGCRLRGPSGSRAGHAMSMSREVTQKVRDRAAENGYNSSPRGRISQVIKLAYDAAQG